MIKNCPTCGKAMAEAPGFPGLWMCPDYVRPIGQALGRYFYRCTGMILTEEGAKAFDRVLQQEHNKMLMRN